MDIVDKLFVNNSHIDQTSVAVLERYNGEISKVSYSSLLYLSRVIAATIEKECSRDDRIAILLPQGSQAYASELAALFCGRVFCPIEQTYPDQRILYCLKDLNPKIVITDKAGASRIAALKLHTIIIDKIKGNPSTSPTPGEDAYIIYTSGSTGNPKGVLVSRKSMNKFLEWSISFYEIKPGDRWAQFSSLGFDLSLIDILTCLPSGGTLVPVSAKIDKMLPGRFVKEFSISVWHSVPSLIPLLLKDTDSAKDQLHSLRLASFCGEPLYPQQASALFSNISNLSIVNTYGPTEGTFFCSALIVDIELCSKIEMNSLPIGNPIPGWNFEFLPDKEEDHYELIIASDYISNGYVSSTPDQLRFGVGTNTRPNMPFYRTGDIVRLIDGHVFFVRRNDGEIKIHGNRLNLSEIEYQALQSGAKEAKAIICGEYIFLAVSLNDSLETKLIKERLKLYLPRYAIPTDVIVLDALPRNDNSKIDTNMLRRLINEKWRNP